MSAEPRLRVVQLPGQREHSVWPDLGW